MWSAIAKRATTTSDRRRTDALSSVATGSAPTVIAWDLPTRIAKWLLVVLVGLAFASRYYGDIGLVWHQWNGLAILVVIVFRLLWSMVGGSTARFTTFLRGPSAMISYASGLLRGRPQHFLGHNPLGGWMVVALLVVVAVEAVTGLFTTDDIIVYGPMTSVVSDRTVAMASALHQKIYPVLLVLIMLHVLANILYSLLGQDNLIRAMVTGNKPASTYVDRAPATTGSVIAAVMCLLTAVVIVFGGIWAAGGSPFP